MAFNNLTTEAKLVFTNASGENVCEEFKAMSVNYANGKIEREGMDDKIREKMRGALHLEKGASSTKIRQALRRYQIDLFEIVEEIIPDLLVTGWP